MSETLQELADIPKDFLREGTLFVRRCTKRTLHSVALIFSGSKLTQWYTADKREFIKISQAVGMGFLIMGAIGYFIKLIHIPVNNILVGGA
ncbi:protein translocation complex subunit SSS1 [Aspergillus arachidicola]|uniref:Protein translocation complex subunit SSS1 n=1 Tax=Aspergillus arachidicola TaxID=656916 RepID=A0A2G7FSY2_9EURO|nr:protein translocation complex subunit SSS1 [Aspergillus arachidicola]